MVQKEGEIRMIAAQNRNFHGSRLFFRPMAEQLCRLPGWRSPHVYWNDYSDYSRYRAARRLQRRRRRTFLRHRILRRRRTRPCHCRAADPAADGKTIGALRWARFAQPTLLHTSSNIVGWAEARQRRAHLLFDPMSSPAQAGDPVFRGVSERPESRGVLDTPLSRSMTAGLEYDGWVCA